MYSLQDLEAVKKIILKNIPQAVSIILFGSYAKGIAKENSDIDILVLLEKDLEWMERKNKLNRLYHDTVQKGYLIDFLLKSKERYSIEKQLPTFSKTVSEEGITLWTKI